MRFEKYHNPNDETQTVDWSHDAIKHKVIRRYTAGPGKSGESEFGENIMTLMFSQSVRSAPSGALKIVKISIDIRGRVNSSGQRRNIITLDTEACLRSGQNAEANVKFVSH